MWEHLQMVGTWLITVAGGLTVLGVAAKTPMVNRPGKWLYRTVVVDPFTQWLRRTTEVTLEASPTLNRLSDQVESVRHEVLPNNGGSLRDRVEDIADQCVDLRDRLDQHILNPDGGNPP